MREEMMFGFHRALAAAIFVAGPSVASAQGNRPWVDPPTTGGIPKAEAPAPATPEAAQRPAPAPAVASKPAASAEAEEPSRPAKKRLARAKPKTIATQRVDRKRTVETRSSTNRRAVADERRYDRMIRDGGGEPLEVMNLRTIEFPDGRRIQVLTRPDPETLSEVLRR
jgi:hypothetical protein